MYTFKFQDYKRERERDSNGYIRQFPGVVVVLSVPVF